MEMGLSPRDLVYFVGLICAGYAAVKIMGVKLDRLIQDVQDVVKKLGTLFNRLDAVEEGKAVMEHRLDVIAGIVSPGTLAKQNRELADLQARLKTLENKNK